MSESVEIPEGYVVAPHFRGYVRFGAGAYLLTICEGDEHGPELVAHLATEEEKEGRTVGDLSEEKPPRTIPLELVAMRLQFSSEAGLQALERQLQMLREQYFPESLAAAPANDAGRGKHDTDRVYFSGALRLPAASRTEPCGECYIQPGETCDRCGASVSAVGKETA